MDVVKSYTPEETEALRREYLEDHIVPAIVKVFAKHKRLQSAVLCVGQYSSDKSSHAVHNLIAFSLEQNPDVENWFAELDGLPDSDSAKLSTLKWCVEGEMTIAEAEIDLDKTGLPRFAGDCLKDINWDEDGRVIPMFAAFCKDDGTPEKSVGENFLPFAIFRQDIVASNIEIEIVGEKVRPWLDGTMPSEDIEVPSDRLKTEALRLEKAVWTKLEDATGGVYLTVQNAMDKWLGDTQEKDEEASELDILISLIMLILAAALVIGVLSVLGFEFDLG